jgi:tRNA threonylcarbamoyladenosine biosynthesis protein TsaE
MVCMSTGLMWQIRSIDSADTERLAELLGRLLSPPQLIELRADLGGGKTTFVRGLARGLGSKDVVSSPSFTLSRIYKFKGGEIHHFDFYRLTEPGVLKDQLKESLNDKNVITVIEWSDIVQDVLPKDRISIEFRPLQTNSDEREITFTYLSQKESIIRRLESDSKEVKP